MRQKEVEQMAEPFASGNWHVMEGKEQDFVKAWTEFLSWTRETHPALEEASLIRDDDDPGHFLSIAKWQDSSARDAWKQSAGFAERFGACRALCDEFSGTNYDRLVHV
jgi:heme-degrading monooxygenase HmoA